MTPIRTLCGLLCLATTACTVGPDFVKPLDLSASEWHAQPRDVASRSTPAPLAHDWWSLFNDPQLSQLIQEAINHNLDLKIAVSRLTQSRIAGQVVGSSGLPQIGFDGDYDRKRNSQKGLNDPSGKQGKNAYDLWQSGLSAAWELDLWGKIRRQVEVADAHIEMAEHDRQAVQLAIVTTTAEQYLRLRGVQASLTMTEQNLAIAREALRLTNVRLAAGVATRLAVAQAATQLASTEAQLPALVAEQTELINHLSLLLAKPPYELAEQLGLPAALPTPPAQVPTGLPSELAERRPDVQRASAALHAATASIGVAKANFYPSINLSGNIGLQSLSFNQLGSWDARHFAIGPSLYLPIFQGGALTGTLKLRKAQHQEAAIDYQRTVLQAWHEVENSLVQFHASQKQQAALDLAVTHSKQALGYAAQQYKQGTVDYLNVLTAQQTLLRSQQQQVASTTATSLAMVSLYKALGGGWQVAATESGAAGLFN
ncbi:MAG: efflux transporter outer membrane subunit [Neisseriaceae bacterium]|nr:efflux transporter outer membrane subunit [Neisseriaceae bacterium]